jgi:hypothetical protein
MIPILIILVALALLAYAFLGMLFALMRLLWVLAPTACAIALMLFAVGLIASLK